MKLIKRSIALAILFLTSTGIYAQTTDEIIA